MAVHLTMSARYQNPHCQTIADSSSIEASFDIENASAETWRPVDGFRIGYHIFDPETGTLIVDGARTMPAADIAPGQTAHIDLRFTVPLEPGRYQVFISAMREDVCWFYERGWPFLLVDATVENGRARLDGLRITSARSVRWHSLLRSIARAFVFPFQTIWRNRSLIRSMVRRDILGRYRGSFGGGFWTVLHPLLLMLTYFFVFGVVLQARFGSDPSRSGFALYFLAGMLPWLAFSEAAGRSPSVMLEHRNFVKKLVFSVETLPVNLVISGLVSELFGLLLFLMFNLLARGAVPATVLWMPVLLIPQLLFTAGLCWFLAALGVFVRDLGQIIGFVLTLWFFLTPICYPESSLPQGAVAILSKNPIYVLVRAYRAILLEGHAPALASLWKFWMIAAAMFICGHAWFYKLRKSFADVI